MNVSKTLRVIATKQAERIEDLQTALNERCAELDAANAEKELLGDEAADLRRQLAECQAAASPALIEEYARACHYAGSSGLAIVDWPQWLRRRQP